MKSERDEQHENALRDSFGWKLLPGVKQTLIE